MFSLANAAEKRVALSTSVVELRLGGALWQPGLWLNRGVRMRSEVRKV